MQVPKPKHHQMLKAAAHHRHRPATLAQAMALVPMATGITTGDGALPLGAVGVMPPALQSLPKEVVMASALGMGVGAIRGQHQAMGLGAAELEVLVAMALRREPELMGLAMEVVAALVEVVAAIQALRNANLNGLEAMPMSKSVAHFKE